MADNRNTYEVTIGGRKHTALLSDDMAKKLYGDQAKKIKAGTEPTRNKAGAKPANKSATS